MKRYLLYVTLPYAYSILRPLEHEIRRRGGEAAWFVEEGCPVVLEEGEVRLGTIREAVAYNPVAVFAPGNYIPDFIPGVKVALFHGYAIQKRIEAVDDHFTVGRAVRLISRNWKRNTASSGSTRPAGPKPTPISRPKCSVNRRMTIR